MGGLKKISAMNRTRHKAGSGGFTLLELMVALALTALLTLVVFGILNLSLKAMGRSEAAAETAQQWRISQTILERSLCSAVSGKKPGVGPGGAGTTFQGKPYFVGGGEEMRFLTAVPLEAHDLGGYYHFRILVGRDEARENCLAVEQTKIVNWRRDQQEVDVRQILLRGLSSLRFTYGDGGEEFQSWDAEERGKLPEWVKIKVALRGGAPQVLIYELYTATAGAESGGQGR